MTTNSAQPEVAFPSPALVTPASDVTQAVWTAGQGSTGAQGTGNQLNVFLHSPPTQRTSAEEKAPAASPAGRVAGALPAVWNIAPRNAGFAGRENELARLHEQLHVGGAAVVQALHGMGGIGKTQLATEYAYRHAADYDVAWWISAEQAGLIGEQYTALGSSLGILDSDADSVTSAHAVKSHLRGRDRWLLIFDNAESPDDISQWLPGGPGHVIITSRHQRWTQLAVSVEVDVLTRAESILLLTAHHPMLSPDQANELAEALGDLPLALVQAASFLAETGMSTQEYRQALTEQAGEVLSEGRPISYPRSLAATIAVSTGRLADVDPASLAILRLCAFLAPAPVPVDLLAAIVQFEAATQEDDSWGLAPLTAVIDKPMPRARSVGRIGDYGLAKVAVEGITVHRLVQAVLRDQLPSTAVEQLRTRIEAVLGMADPGDPRDTAAWPSWARLLPHLLAADPASTDNPDLRDLACRAIVFLIVRGDARPAQQLANHLYEQWRHTLGPDHSHTLKAVTELVWAYRDLGELKQLRSLIEDTLTRQRLTLGEDHPDTLRSISYLAVILDMRGDHKQARRMEEDVLERWRRVLGEDHPETLSAVSSLAGTLHSLGEYESARQMQQDVLERRRRVLGEDHPDTLRAVSNLAGTLHSLGEYESAWQMQQDVLERWRRVLGEDHPETLSAVSNLASTLHSLGEYESARQMQQDVLERRRRVFGEDHPDTLRAVSNLASTLHSLGEYESARRMEEDVLERRRRVLGEDHPDTLSAVGNLASTLHRLGEYESARRMEEDVLERWRRVFGEDHPDTLRAVSNLASTLHRLGEYESARRMKEDVLERWRRVLGEDHPDTLRAVSSLASTLHSLGEYESARQMQQDVLERQRRVIGTDHPETLVSAVNLAMSCAALNQKMAARKMAEEGFQGLRTALGNGHYLTQWSRKQLNGIAASMGGRRQRRNGHRR
ncbi:FxSxx-COOH system tetratricopeptide repeat protein [Micromonospora sp. NPDC001898]|uniref:FxSxx-COOH system tetratricopeptide repeat protein n=1 Tax=Micromonospora sp. NPDC001898 TaxID=3364221 RepID=UPI0036879B36